MGTEVIRAVIADDELELVAAVDPALSGIDIRQVAKVDGNGLHIEGSIESLLHSKPEVVVDFTNARAAFANLKFLAEGGFHAVCGSTGISDEDLVEVGKWFGNSDGPNAVIAANFAVGAVLMMSFAKLAAPYFEGVEIIEMHHDAKVDAPSGTAVATAQIIKNSREQSGLANFGEDPTERFVIDGARGAKGPGDISIHSVRLRGLVAHQEIIFGTNGQTLTLRHDSFDRTSFMPGVLIAIKAVSKRPGLTMGLAPILGI